MRTFLIGSAILQIFLSSACINKEGGLAEHVFQDFVYSGAEPLRNEREEFNESDVLVKPKVPQGGSPPVPTVFQRGMQYRFICPEPCRVDNLAIHVLPRRLTEVGAQNMKHPSSPQQLMFLDIGGPLFRITFEWNDQSYRITNTPNQVFLLQVP